MSRFARAGESGVLLALTAIVLLATAGPLNAQGTTATVQGTVADASGVLPGAVVLARDKQSGFQFETTTDIEGRFTLAGLRPGTYDITVSMPQYKPQAKTIQVLVGQTVTADFKVSPDVVVIENVTVIGNARLVEMKSSEVTTNVTDEQIRYLPQNSRNFLNFAALAPGVRVRDSDTSKEFTAGALASRNTNVFIDGVSYKNDVIEGGVVGQDSSRGNPFPQNAVQEFQVLTQNYKAEYEKASSAIITAITKSGGNRWSGEIFNFYQDKRLVQNETIVRDANNLFVKGRITPKPTYERWQWGASLGGPIIKDRMQVFGSYEENRQDRANTVLVGTVTTAPPDLVSQLRQFEGVFVQPFTEKLLFAKGSYQPKAGQAVEVTYNLRTETEIRGFGGTSSFQAAERFRNQVNSVLGKWQLTGSGFLNEAYLSYQRYRWNPEPLNLDLVGLNYQGLARIGGRSTRQLFVQQRFSIRDDWSRFLKWRGNHTVKLGGVMSFADYEVRKEFDGNPVFEFRSSIGNYAFPFEARYGTGNPDLSADNQQIGFFGQDDWAVTPRLTLSLGLRWDYESEMLNNDYVTPANVVAAAAPFVDDDRYFTDGTKRPTFFGMWQPRLGASYDVTGKGTTVAFAGWGRQYDRVLYNHTLDERFRLQYLVRTFRFSADGSPRDGAETIKWDPSYLSRAGLDGLIARGLAPDPEVFLIDNETEPPVTDQFTVGLRHKLGPVLTSVSYAGVRGQNEFTFLFGNRRPDGTCCQEVKGTFSRILRSSDAKKSWYDAMFLQMEKPLAGWWGATLTYTLGRAEQIGGDLFSLDFPTVEDYPRFPTSNDERHRVVATGIVRLPFDVLVSTFITLGSGTPYTITDESLGPGVNQRRVLRNAGRPDQFAFIIPDAWAFRSVDLHAEKTFRFGIHRASVIFQGFNIFSYDNFSGYQGFIPTLPAVNLNFGRPNSLIDPGRRLQFGLRYGF